MIDIKKPLENANLTVNCEYMDLFDMNSHSERKIYLNDEIEAISAHDVIYEILRFNVEDKDIAVSDRKPILLYCTSVGGSVIDGFGIVDAILSSKTSVYTINLAYQYSMGFLIGLAGHKRYAMPNAEIMIHQPSGGAKGQETEIRIVAEQILKTRERLNQILADNTGKPLDVIVADTERDNYMTAEEAKAYGLVDHVITKRA